MDKKTLEVYDQNAASYAEDWMSQPTPSEIHDLVRKYFHAGEKTADIGAGSGRDCEWLHRQGFPCTGYDGSTGLLAEARKNFPHLNFYEATLPDLKEIPDQSFHNVLCETVLQHLPVNTHADCLRHLMRITAPGGVLSLSFRHPLQIAGDREKDARLYVLVNSDELIRIAEKAGARLLHRATLQSASSQKKISQLVFKIRG